jgi:hypothetical protein
MAGTNEVEIIRVIVLQVDEFIRPQQAMRRRSVQRRLGLCVEAAEAGRAEMRQCAQPAVNREPPGCRRRFGKPKTTAAMLFFAGMRRLRNAQQQQIARIRVEYRENRYGFSPKFGSRVAAGAVARDRVAGWGRLWWNP